MRKILFAFATLATVSTAFIVPSMAASHERAIEVQWNDGHRDRRPHMRNDRRRATLLPPRQIARTLERRGYAVGDIDRQRDTYRVRASRHNGARVILRVDGYNGRILDEKRVGRRR